MFPSEAFRWAYDALCETCTQRVADKEYLRILNHAAQTMESAVEETLLALRDQKRPPRWEAVLDLIGPVQPELPTLDPLTVDLTAYDRLLLGKEADS